MGLWNPPQAVSIDYSQIDQRFADQESFIEQRIQALNANSVLQKTINIPQGGTSTLIADVEQTRKGLSLANVGTSTVWIDVQPSITNQKYTAYVQPGGYYDFPCPFENRVWAWCPSGVGKLEVRDYVRIQEL